MTSKVKLKCKPNVLDIYSYLMYHSFYGMPGVARMGLSILFLGVAWGAAGQAETILVILLALVGFMNPVVTPLFLYIRAVQMEKQEKWMNYELDEDKVFVSQNGITRRLSWTSFPLIVWGRRVVMLYVDESHALLLPKSQMDDPEAVLEILAGLSEKVNVRCGRKNRQNSRKKREECITL